MRTLDRFRKKTDDFFVFSKNANGQKLSIWRKGNWPLGKDKPRRDFWAGLPNFLLVFNEALKRYSAKVSMTSCKLGINTMKLNEIFKINSINGYWKSGREVWKGMSNFKVFALRNVCANFEIQITLDYFMASQKKNKPFGQSNFKQICGTAQSREEKISKTFLLLLRGYSLTPRMRLALAQCSLI